MKSSHGPTTAPPEPRAVDEVVYRPRRHRSVWMAISALFVVAGFGGSLYAFDAVRNATATSHKQLSSSSVEIAGALRLAIQHEQDLIVSTESFIVGNPHPSQAQFTAWANDVNVLHRYPELFE